MGAALEWLLCLVVPAGIALVVWGERRWSKRR
jgi:hypothetical protein